MTGSHRPAEERRHAVGRPPTIRQRLEETADNSDPLTMDTDQLPTFNAGVDLIAHQVPRQSRASLGNVYRPGRDYGPGRAQVRLETKRRGWARAIETAIFVVLELGLLVLAAWSVLGGAFLADDERLMRVSDVSPFLVLFAAVLLALVLLLWLLWRDVGRP